MVQQLHEFVVFLSDDIYSLVLRMLLWSVFALVPNRRGLNRENPRVKMVEAARRTCTYYSCVQTRKQGCRRSSSRGGYNEELNIHSSSTLKEGLLIYHRIGRGASIDHIITSTNLIL